MPQDFVDSTLFLQQVSDVCQQQRWRFCQHYQEFPAGRALLEFALAMPLGGKQIRAALVRAGWLAAGGPDADPALIKLAAAVELYQVSALIHDDLIDQANTRRGFQTTHTWAAKWHRQQDGQLTDQLFAMASAVLLGDIYLSLADDLCGQAARELDSSASISLNQAFAHMTSQVALGQYLDVATAAFPSLDPEVSLHLAKDVITNKTVSYSALHPLRLGALAAGGSKQLLEKLSQLGKAWGFAFQLRDDQLGIFGDEKETGKPTGDDLREGKRTVLIALTLKNASETQRELILGLLGKADLDDSQIAQIRQIIKESGAYAQHEALIDSYAKTAQNVISQLELSPQVLELFEKLGQQITSRRL